MALVRCLEPLSLGMNSGGSVTGVQRFDINHLTPEPWRNGAGITRTVASSEMAGQLLWRISAADIAHDSDFSAFPGMQRTAVLISGGGLLLQGAEALRLERIGDTACFAGESVLQARLQHAPARLWNVMLRRSSASAQVHVQQKRAMQLTGCGCDVLLVLAGQLQVSGDTLGESFALQPQQGLLMQVQTPPHLYLQSLQPNTQWIHTSVHLLAAAEPLPYAGSALF